MDLPKAELVIRKAYEYVALADNDSKSGSQAMASMDDEIVY
jgi:hypothetical protein